MRPEVINQEGERKSIMKKKLSLLLAIAFLIALFAGCSGDKDKSPGSESPTPGQSANATPDNSADGGEEGDSPYAFAKGKFAADADGIATEKYDYVLPLSTTDEVFSFWTSCYTPFAPYLEGDYADSPFPVELQNRTGVHIEYKMISAESRSENFSVLLASDDLPDIMSQASYFYGGVFKDAITEDNWFANIYDYREYCPNYFYEVTKDPSDKNIRSTVFIDDNVVGNFYCLRDKAYKQNTLFVRSDWLDRIGWTREDIVTWQDTHDLLTAFKTNIETATYPCLLYNTLESAGTHWNMYDTVAYISPYAAQIYVDENKQVYAAHTTDRDRLLMTDIAQWFSEGLFDPDWMSYSDMTNDGFRTKWVDDQFGYIVLATSDCSTETHVLDDPDAQWLALRDPVLTEGQTLHLGDERSRVFFGSAAVSAKCENIPLVMTYLDWRYSDEGADLMSWGVEGICWEYDENGNRRVSDFLIDNEGCNYTMMLLIYCLNTLCDPGLDINSVHYNYDGGEVVIEAYEYLDKRDNYDGAYEFPTGITYTAEQLGEIASCSSDVLTYIQENFLSFVDGSTPMSKWDDYTAKFAEVGLYDLLAVYQEAYDDYMAEHA